MKTEFYPFSSIANSSMEQYICEIVTHLPRTHVHTRAVEDVTAGLPWKGHPKLFSSFNNAYT